MDIAHVSPRRPIAPLSAVMFAVLVACSFEPDYDGTQYDCASRCPSGYECVEGHCERPGGPGDDAGTDPGLDAGPIDAVTDAAVASCDEQFGDAPSYSLCAETATTCSFDVATVGTCDETCVAFGGTCVSATDSDSGTPCDDQGPTACDTVHSSQICECTRGE